MALRLVKWHTVLWNPPHPHILMCLHLQLRFELTRGRTLSNAVVSSTSVLFCFLLSWRQVLQCSPDWPPTCSNTIDSASQALPRFPRDYRSEAQHPALAYSLQGADLIYQEETIPSQFQTQGGSGYLGHSICSLCSRLWLGEGGWENTRRRGNGECWSECGRDQWLLYQLVFRYHTH